MIRAFLPNAILDKNAIRILVLTQLTVLVLLWCFSSFPLLPKPTEVVHAFSELWVQGLGAELITSFVLNLEAIGVATVVSLLFSYAAVLPAFRPMVALLGKFRFLSPVGLTYFFTLVTRSGHELKLSLLAFSVSVFFVTSMADVIDNIPKAQFDLARTLRMGEWRVMWEVVVLGQIDKVFDVLRQNAAMSWLLITLVESMVRSEGGIGTVLLDQNHHFHIAAIFAIQTVILLMGIGQDYGIGVAKNLFCPYASLTLERK